jgi:metallo-beta-lactamase family protein
MCTGGRIRHHFKHRIWRDDTHVVFAGFQAAHTLGRQLVDGKQYIRMFGDQFMVRAQIHTLGGFSAHASRSELLEWVGAIGGHPKIRLVHGEPEALEAMQGALAERDLPATIAQPGETVDL